MNTPAAEDEASAGAYALIGRLSSAWGRRIELARRRPFALQENDDAVGKIGNVKGLEFPPPGSQPRRARQRPERGEQRRALPAPADHERGPDNCPAKKLMAFRKRQAERVGFAFREMKLGFRFVVGSKSRDPDQL